MTPSRRDRLKPVEYVGFAGGIGIFSGLVVLLVIREPIHALVIGGVAFIVSLVVIATLTLAMQPAKPGEGDDDGRPRGH
ncbi:hypothetical protein GCM10009846_29750 [Agrococcus versicolor]|uniref:ABC transporter ATP-binding protein n=1 Tax=Agrococcus versicolor TaxID=501482 RepID=A0ABN3AY85_9MICO